MAIDKDAGTVTKKVVKSSPGLVQGLRVTSISSSLRWFQIHNKATAPTGGDTPLDFYPLPAGSSSQPTVLEMYESHLGGSIDCGNGVSWAISTTAGTFTDSATANEHTVSIRST